MPEITDLLGHVAYLFIFSGMWLLGKKNIWGWPLKAVGDVIWLVLGIQLGMSSIWMWEIGFLSAAAYGVYCWRKSEQ